MAGHTDAWLAREARHPLTGDMRGGPLDREASVGQSVESTIPARASRPGDLAVESMGRVVKEDLCGVDSAEG